MKLFFVLSTVLSCSFNTLGQFVKDSIIYGDSAFICPSCIVKYPINFGKIAEGYPTGHLFIKNQGKNYYCFEYRFNGGVEHDSGESCIVIIDYDSIHQTGVYTRTISSEDIFDFKMNAIAQNTLYKKATEISYYVTSVNFKLELPKKEAISNKERFIHPFFAFPLQSIHQKVSSKYDFHPDVQLYMKEGEDNKKYNAFQIPISDTTFRDSIFYYDSKDLNSNFNDFDNMNYRQFPTNQNKICELVLEGEKIERTYTCYFPFDTTASKIQEHIKRIYRYKNDTLIHLSSCSENIILEQGDYYNQKKVGKWIQSYGGNLIFSYHQNSCRECYFERYYDSLGCLVSERSINYKGNVAVYSVEYKNKWFKELNSYAIDSYKRTDYNENGIPVSEKSGQLVETRTGTLHPTESNTPGKYDKKCAKVDLPNSKYVKLDYYWEEGIRYREFISFKSSRQFVERIFN